MPIWEPRQFIVQMRVYLMYNMKCTLWWSNFLATIALGQTMQQLVIESFSSHGFFLSIYFLGHSIWFLGFLDHLFSTIISLYWIKWMCTIRSWTKWENEYVSTNFATPCEPWWSRSLQTPTLIFLCSHLLFLTLYRQSNQMNNHLPTQNVVRFSSK